MRVILVFFAFFSAIFYFNLSFIADTKNYLDIPQISEVVLPRPIYLTHLSQNVLGSQVIEPTDIVKYVNVERNKRGANSLIINDKLMHAAKLRADVILNHQNFSHQDPFEGIELVTVLPRVSYYYKYASENIGMGGLSGEDFVFGFMHSTSHRLNLLNPDLYHTGVAVVTGAYKQYYVNIAVQLFGIPSSHEEYLGYSEKDAKTYKKKLLALKFRLNPLFQIPEKIFKKDEQKYSNMKRQEEILSSLLTKINTKSPFNQNEVNLVNEFNSYL